MHILSVLLMVSPDEYQCGISRQILSYFLRISYVFTCVRMHYRENTEHMLVFDINFDNFYMFFKTKDIKLFSSTHWYYSSFFNDLLY